VAPKLAYGWPVERRHGWLATLGLYTAASIAGILLENVTIRGANFVPVLGASAGFI
jgi:membrane associated rhomboid family serine protease